MKIYLKVVLITLAIGLITPINVFSATINVNVGESIQTAIDSAQSGDTISIAAGEFDEDINLGSKNLEIVGSSLGDTTIRGTGVDSVITINGGQNGSTLIDRLEIIRGLATNGGGILVENSCPRITRNTIRRNRADISGSGIYVLGNCSDGTSSVISNNLIAKNSRSTKSLNLPSGIEARDSSPTIINNTFVSNRQGGFLYTGDSAPTLMNNIFANNRRHGIRAAGLLTETANASIQYNLFSRQNRQRRAVVFEGREFRKATSAEIAVGNPLFINNIDGAARFRSTKNLNVRLRSKSRAIDAGNPGEQFNDVNGTANDAGLTGGPSPHLGFL